MHGQQNIKKRRAHFTDKSKLCCPAYLLLEKTKLSTQWDVIYQY